MFALRPYMRDIRYSVCARARSLFFHVASVGAVTSEFDCAVAYSWNRLGNSDLELKLEQKTSIRHIYEGKDVFVWLPTGFGKSICYETLAVSYLTTLAEVIVSGETALLLVSFVYLSCPLDATAPSLLAKVYEVHHSFLKEYKALLAFIADVPA